MGGKENKRKGGGTENLGKPLERNAKKEGKVMTWKEFGRGEEEV